MGWFAHNLQHEGYAVAYILDDFGVRQLSSRDGDKIDIEVGWIGAACDCGWRSAVFRPYLPAQWMPYTVLLEKGDENRVYELWEAHSEQPLPVGARGLGCYNRKQTAVSRCKMKSILHTLALGGIVRKSGTGVAFIAYRRAPKVDEFGNKENGRILLTIDIDDDPSYPQESIVPVTQFDGGAILHLNLHDYIDISEKDDGQRLDQMVTGGLAAIMKIAREEMERGKPITGRVTKRE